MEGSEVMMKLARESDGERILPPFPMELAVPSPIAFPISIGAQKPYDVLPILPPSWTKVYVHWPRPELAPPGVSPYVTIRIPLFALGYGQSLFKQLNKQLRAVAEWLMTAKVHTLHGVMRTGRPASYYREWAIEQIEGAIDKVEASKKVCEVLLLVEKVQEKERRPLGCGRADSYRDFANEPSDEIMRARIRRRVPKWLKQAGIRLR
jgi:hypothetical protein